MLRMFEYFISVGLKVNFNIRPSPNSSTDDYTVLQVTLQVGWYNKVNC